jgi:hypothetical protein
MLTTRLFPAPNSTRRLQTIFCFGSISTTSGTLRDMPLFATERRTRGPSISALPPRASRRRLFRNGNGVVQLDADVAHRAFDFAMTEQQLGGPEIALRW